MLRAWPWSLPDIAISGIEIVSLKNSNLPKSPLHLHDSFMEEMTLWKGGSSQWLNLGSFSLGLLTSIGIGVAGLFFPPAYLALLIPASWVFWRFLLVRCQTYELSSERLRITQGVINQKIDEVELYRVKDVLLERKWWMRILGLGTLSLETSDRSLAQIEIAAIPDSIQLREMLRQHIPVAS
jgi:membrane protein YdbS with pleckstrin-like domain